MATCSIIEVDMDSLKKDVDNMSDKINEINSDMDKMFTEILELSGMWKGAASDTFRKQFEADKEAFTGLVEQLKKIASNFDEARNEYIRCENDVAAEVNAIKVG